jgi:ABC-type branched-subunit amino acid transport system substrate-binding protein
VLEAPYAAGDEASILEAAQRLDSAGAQAVLIPDTLEVAVKILSNVTNATRTRMRPLGTALWDNPVKVANSQALFNKAVFVTPFFPQSLRPVVQQFSESYKGKFKTAPNFLAAQGFDAGTLVVAALRRAAQEGTTFTDAFAKLPPYEGVTGAIRVEPSGEVRRAFYVVEVTPTGFVERFPGTTPSATASSLSKPITQPSAFLSDEERVESGY